jgi:hypothetical protein
MKELDPEQTMIFCSLHGKIPTFYLLQWCLGLNEDEAGDVCERQDKERFNMDPQVIAIRIQNAISKTELEAAQADKV